MCWLAGNTLTMTLERDCHGVVRCLSFFVLLIWLPGSWTFFACVGLYLCTSVHSRSKWRISGRLQFHSSASVIREAEWEHTTEIKLWPFYLGIRMGSQSLSFTLWS